VKHIVHDFLEEKDVLSKKRAFRVMGTGR